LRRSARPRASRSCLRARLAGARDSEAVGSIAWA
jgi:hypothetical protein